MKKSQLRVGFLTSSDPRDRSAWSGTQHFMYAALSNAFENLIPLGPLHSNGFYTAGKIISKFNEKVGGKRTGYLHSRTRSKILAKKIQRKLRVNKCDVIFAPAGSAEIAWLETNTPICYLSDTSFAQIINYYDRYSNLSNSAISKGNDLEQRAIEKASVIVYASDWAASFTKQNYRTKRKSIEVVPFGANIEASPERSSVIPTTLPNGTWNLLFLGIFWERKGGELAIETLEELIRRGYDVKLTVLGCTPPVKHEKMEVIPFLNKNEPKDYSKFKTILNESQILFLPTKAEAYGVVFCEAAAYGIPSITRATGGTTTAVQNGQNGYALPYHSTHLDYANVVEELILNPQKYLELCKTSRDRYENVLNWTSWANSMRKILENIAN